ncbi:MAG: pyruvate ferredoxin oxidoreductase [Deltaproteobacteria bacterium]|nr:MAG: pyruvate ferredoxin oxidoreductase [Deltaproteobacteria bacterium]
MKKLLTGNQAFSQGVKLARVRVITAFPITPQTSVVEELAKMCAAGTLQAKFIRVESEHSSMACTAAASMTGVRTFTATSSHGLAYMHEMLHWASGSRLPIVMVNVSRAIGAPWSIWFDQSDSLSQRDTGWLQIYCATNQECLDTVIHAYRLAETILLPVMIVSDGFILSHTVEPVELPTQQDVDAFLRPYVAKYKLDPKDPHVFNILAGPEDFMGMRRISQEDMEGAVTVLKETDTEFQKTFGRSYGLLEAYGLEDAETVMIGLGATCETAKDVVDDLRQKGMKVGLLRVRLFRPFPAEEIKQVLYGTKRVAVIDRAVSIGAGGILSQEIKQALFNTEYMPEVFSFITGLGGVDVTPELLNRIFLQTMEASENPTKGFWMEASS